MQCASEFSFVKSPDRKGGPFKAKLRCRKALELFARTGSAPSQLFDPGQVIFLSLGHSFLMLKWGDWTRWWMWIMLVLIIDGLLILISSDTQCKASCSRRSARTQSNETSPLYFQRVLTLFCLATTSFPGSFSLLALTSVDGPSHTLFLFPT